MAKIDYREISVGAVKSVTLQVDMTRIEREVFGLFRWRLILAKIFFRLGVFILRINVEFKK